MQIRLLLSTQRSGSHFLKAFIDSRFPGVACSDEVLLPPQSIKDPALPGHEEVPYFWNWYERAVASGNFSPLPDQRLAAFGRYIDEVAAVAAPADLLLDIKYNSLRTLSGYWDTENGSGDFGGFLSNRAIPVLHLVRRNVLKILVSNELARKTKVWHRTDALGRDEKLPQFQLEPKQALNFIRYSCEVTEDYHRRFFNSPGYEQVAYEDLVLEERSGKVGPALIAVTRFLQKAPFPSAARVIPLKKTTPDDPALVVENWDEVVRSLRGTKYAWMTESPLQAAA